MVAGNNSFTSSSKSEQPRQWAQIAGFLLKGILLCLAVLFSLVALLYLIPDGNDYAKATIEKHARLAAPVEKKLVFAGGSNLPYGLQSHKIEDHFKIHTVNMGMNGFLGVQFILGEIRDEIEAGDIVVLSFEYDSLFISANGSPKDVLMMVKTRPAALKDLNYDQLKEVAFMVPEAATSKVIRIYRHELAKLKARSKVFRNGEETNQERGPVIPMVSVHAGFNRHGDLESHYGVEWPVELQKGLVLSEIELNPETLETIQREVNYLDSKGAKVIWLPCSVYQGYFNSHRARIEELYAALRKMHHLIVGAPPERYAFPLEHMFDKDYHLTREGAEERTRRVIEDLAPHLRQAGIRGGNISN